MESDLGDVQAFLFSVVRVANEWVNSYDGNPTSFDTLNRIKELLSELQD